MGKKESKTKKKRKEGRPVATIGGGAGGHGGVGLGHGKDRCHYGRARVCHGDSAAARTQRDEKRELIGCDSVQSFIYKNLRCHHVIGGCKTSFYTNSLLNLFSTRIRIKIPSFNPPGWCNWW